MLLGLIAALAVVRVSMQPADGASACRGPAVVTLACSCPTDSVSRQVEVPGDAAFDVDPNLRWTATVARDGCWAAPMRLEDGAQIRVWPSATLTGSFAGPNHNVAKQIDVRIQAGKAIPEATFSCPVRDGKWRCKVPAIPFDARLQVNGYAPLYLWQQHVRAGEIHDTGERRLEPGASISGRVEWPRDEKTRPAEVTLRVRAFLHGGEAAGQLAMAAMTATSDARGFFQFRGVPPGAYTITANAAGAAAVAQDIDVSTTAEVELHRPLLLLPPAPLSVRVSPPSAPGSQPWVVVLQRPVPGSTFLAPFLESHANREGIWSGVAPAGNYIVSVRDDHGSVQHREPISLDGAGASISIELPLIEVTGTVRAGTRPIRGALTFAAGDGTSVVLQTDDDGVYTGTLPKAGKWNVKIRPSAQRMYFAGINVEVAKRNDETVARVDITLPGGSLRGKVSDQIGNAVEADVQILRDGHLLAVTASAANGEFAVDGLPVGVAAVHAETDDAESAVMPLNITDAGDVTCDVVVARARRVQGFASTRSGRPVTGALIRYIGSSFLDQRETTTGPSGEFTLAVPPETTIVDCVVIAGGLPTTITRLLLSPQKRPIDLVIEETSGVLKIALSSGVRPFIGKDGAIVSLSTLFPPRAGGPPPGFTGDGYEARLAPGSYDVCPDRVRNENCRNVQLAPMSWMVADVSTKGTPSP